MSGERDSRLTCALRSFIERASRASTREKRAYIRLVSSRSRALVLRYVLRARQSSGGWFWRVGWSRSRAAIKCASGFEAGATGRNDAVGCSRQFLRLPPPSSDDERATTSARQRVDSSFIFGARRRSFCCESSRKKRFDEPIKISSPSEMQFERKAPSLSTRFDFFRRNFTA